MHHNQEESEIYMPESLHSEAEDISVKFDSNPQSNKPSVSKLEGDKFSEGPLSMYGENQSDAGKISSTSKCSLFSGQPFASKFYKHPSD